MRISRLGMASALLLFCAASLDAQGARVAYVNSQQVLAEYAPAQEARQQLESVFQENQSELQLMSSGLESSLAEYQQQAMSMTPETRQNRERELQNLQQALQNRTQELELQFQQRQQEVMQPVTDRITAVIEELRVEGNYAVILDLASQAIVAADPALDLTQEVLTRLQAQENPGSGGG